MDIQQLAHLVVIIKGQVVTVRLVTLDRGYGLQDLAGKVHLKAPTLHQLMSKL